MLIKKVMPRSMRGFTLTEAAIVLGIVGLILGAIWVAAAAVYNNLRVSKTTEQLLTVVQNIRSMHATQQTVDAALDELTVARAGGMPSDMLDNPGVPTVVRDVWAGNVDIIASDAGGAGMNDGFSIAFAEVPRGACADLLVRATGSGRDTGLVGVAVAAGATGAAGTAVTTRNPGMFPITVVAATSGALCVNPLNTVSFTFRLRG